MKPAMIIHGGAGSGKFGRRDARFRELRNALEEGMAALKKGSSLDGVEASVRYMESCGAFNAGRGACLTAEGTLQLDAAVMQGDGRKGAGVGAVKCTYNPVSLARWVMENTGHVLVVGEECKVLANAAGLKVERLVPSPGSSQKYRKLVAARTGRNAGNYEFWKKMQDGNTVGAVAIDSAGMASAAVSTGGMWLKLPGRVGDSAVLGAGIYADSAGASCATGTGEEIIKNALAWNTGEFLKSTDAAGAARKAIALMSRRSGKGSAGIITVDAKGRVGFAYNTEAMGRAWCDQDGRSFVRV
ncbi:MAG: isoaspartyl peptidase/L-asparaginase [Nitrososphaerales archaeon]|nr:isoaspartyl peptidase/L-asparaginase [Nitrososphaerales archaeon]